eukprot:COSAG01_NODE_2403_length_7757_cov_4.745887_5_plen_156_part_00
MAMDRRSVLGSERMAGGARRLTGCRPGGYGGGILRCFRQRPAVSKTQRDASGSTLLNATSAVLRCPNWRREGQASLPRARGSRPTAGAGAAPSLARARARGGGPTSAASCMLNVWVAGIDYQGGVIIFPLYQGTFLWIEFVVLGACGLPFNSSQE